MTNQEIFDKVVTHLRTQGEPAMDDGTCVYRGPNNTMCAVGCLIPNKLYDSDIEGTSVLWATNNKDTRSGKKLIEILSKVFGLRIPTNLLKDLQRVHDECALDGRWDSCVENGLEAVAHQYNLDYTRPSND